MYSHEGRRTLTSAWNRKTKTTSAAATILWLQLAPYLACTHEHCMTPFLRQALAVLNEEQRDHLKTTLVETVYEVCANPTPGLSISGSS